MAHQPPPGHYSPQNTTPYQQQGQYPPPQFQAPPGRPQRRGNPVLRVTITIIVMLAIVGGVIYYNLNKDTLDPPDGSEAAVGQCITGENDVSDTTIVDCTDAKAAYKVVDIDHTPSSNPDEYCADATEATEATEATDLITVSRKGRVKYVLCLVAQ